MELKTERLCLRPITRKDLGAVLAYACDRSNAEYMVYYPKTEQEAVSYVEETASQWEEEEADGVEIGWILNRHYWGCGYGTEAAAAVLRFMSEELGISSCISCCDTRNIASARMMEKLGMKRILQRARIYGRRGEAAQEYVYQWTV